MTLSFEIYCLRNARSAISTVPFASTSAALYESPFNCVSLRRYRLSFVRSERSTTLLRSISPYTIFCTGAEVATVVETVVADVCGAGISRFPKIV